MVSTCPCIWESGSVGCSSRTWPSRSFKHQVLMVQSSKYKATHHERNILSSFVGEISLQRSLNNSKQTSSRLMQAEKQVSTVAKSALVCACPLGMPLLKCRDLARCISLPAGSNKCQHYLHGVLNRKDLSQLLLFFCASMPFWNPFKGFI